MKTIKTPKPYPFEERAKARALVKRLRELSRLSREAMQTGQPLDSATTEVMVSLTQSVNPATQINMVDALADKVQAEHAAKLLPLAADEFNAFCEYVNPDEPPAGKWLEWLTGTLQNIEMKAGNERFVLNVPPGHAKPLSVDTLVLMGDGSWKRLGDVKVGEFVISHTGARRKVTEVHEQGELDVLKLTTKCGRAIITAPDHSFLIKRDKTGPFKNVYLKAEQMRPGDVLTVRTHSDALGNRTPYEIDSFEFAAYCVTNLQVSYRMRNAEKYKVARFVCARKEVISRAVKCMERLDISHKPPYFDEKNEIWVCFISEGPTRKLKSFFHLDQKSKDRTVPEFVFNGGKPEIGRFLSTVINNCGVVNSQISSTRVKMSFRSERLADELQRLFGAFNVHVKKDISPKGHPFLYLERADVEDFEQAGLNFEGRYAERFHGKILTRELNNKRPYKRKEVPADVVKSIEPAGRAECRCLTVEVDHTFIANGLVVHNSTYASRLFVAWRMGRRPRDKIIGGGHSQRFVENEFSKKIRNLVGSQEYKAVFPHIAIDASTRAADQWANSSGGSYVAKGAGQAIHGFRANFACIDDPYAKISDAESPVTREEIKTWFFNDIGSRLLPGAQLFLIMTRFHEEDLTGACEAMNKEFAARDIPEAAHYKILTAPAICYDPDNDVLGRREGEVLWPYYNLEFFENKRVEWSFQRFALVYQQVPDAMATGSIASHFQYYDYLPHLTKEALAEARDAGKIDPGTLRPITSPRDHFVRIVLSVDTASKTNERADYSVGMVWGETKDRQHYLIDMFRDKVEFNEMIEKIETMARKWNVDAILVEDKGQGTAYIQARGKTDHQRLLAPAPIQPISVPASQGKEFRFDEVTPMIEQGSIHLPKRAPWIELLVREIGQFPDGAHDDMVDAMSQYLRWAKTKRSRYGTRKISSQG